MGTATGTETQPSDDDRLEQMGRDELLMAARIYKALSERRLELIGQLEVRLEDERQRVLMPRRTR